MLEYIAYTALGILGIAAWQLRSPIVKSFTSPLKDLPGPPRRSWLLGYFPDIWREDNSVLQEKWVQEYGPTISYSGLFGIYRLWTTDTRALNYVLTHSADFEKPEETRDALTKLLGAGILITEGEQHRQQRRVMNPAFGPAQIRELTSIFFEKATELKEVWASEIARNNAPTRIDVLSGLSKMTLDVIGLAGFNYEFNSLNPSGKPNELSKAFTTMFEASTKFEVLPLLKILFPPLKLFHTKRERITEDAQKVMRRIGMQLVEEKKAALRAQAQPSTTKLEKEGVSRKDMQGRDLLTLLLKANMANDIPEGQRLTDEEVLAQVPTFLVAGHETTSSATTWCLFALTQAPHVQNKLRDELMSVGTSTPTMDELIALPYLDAVARETLRLHPPVPMTVRVPTKEDFIPLNTPFTDRKGQVHTTIRVTKNDAIFIPILAMNRDKQLWGEDSFEFKPERWEKLPELVSGIPGVWGSNLSFLGGPRSCIGYRFALVEMKALIFTLVRAFEFKLAVPPENVRKVSMMVQRPVIKGEEKNSNQMPLIITPVSNL